MIQIMKSGFLLYCITTMQISSLVTNQLQFIHLIYFSCHDVVYLHLFSPDYILPVIFNNLFVHIILAEKGINLAIMCPSARMIFVTNSLLYCCLICFVSSFNFICLSHLPECVFNFCSSFSVEFCLIYVDKEFS